MYDGLWGTIVVTELRVKYPNDNYFYQHKNVKCVKNKIIPFYPNRNHPMLTQNNNLLHTYNMSYDTAYIIGFLLLSLNYDTKNLILTLI